MVEFVRENQLKHPIMYMVPKPPAAWRSGTINHRVEAIMHLAMNTQKAVFKLVLHWAATRGHGSALLKRLQPLVQQVTGLRLSYLPVRMFKNDKFGGYVAEIIVHWP